MVAMTVGSTEEPILCRMDRLDNILRQLEEIRGCSNINRASHSHSHSPKSSSCVSTPSRTSGTLMSDGGHVSSAAEEFISPESLEKHCRPIQHVMMETDVKGTLIERLDHVEDRVLKLCMQLEEELIERAEKKRDGEIVKSEKEEKIIIDEIERTQVHVIKKKRKGLKQLVKQCVMGKGKPNK